jgi:murein DD-endopeptidase MepM/ murein hydrolase activator NlpD
VSRRVILGVPLLGALLAAGAAAPAGGAAPGKRAAKPRHCAPARVQTLRGRVVVTRGGERVRHTRRRPIRALQAGDKVAVHKGGRLELGKGRWRVAGRHAGLRIGCGRARPGLDLRWGRVHVAGRAPGLSTRDAVVTQRAGARSTIAAGPRRTITRQRRGQIRVAARRVRRASLLANQPGDVIWVDRGALPRFDVWPFPRPLADRRPRGADRLPSLYADGRSCSTGCRPRGARNGWPLKPFHRQHPLRAGFNELRTGSMHVGIDIQAEDQAPVYAIQPGRVRPIADSGPDARLRVGSYIYWHVNRSVPAGTRVRPFHTLLGHTLPGFLHLHLTEVRGGDQDYVFPLRRGGRSLFPMRERVPPVIGTPHFSGGGRAIVPAFDPQSFRRPTPNHTPVLAVSGLAWRLDRGPLEWAYRGTHLADFYRRYSIFAYGSYSPGFTCFYTQVVCRPNWTMVLAGGYAPRIPQRSGRHVVHIYAWDWAGNRTARDWVIGGGA